jgi:hypothetical protein
MVVTLDANYEWKMVLRVFWGSFYVVGRLIDLYLVVFIDVFMRVGVL